MKKSDEINKFIDSTYHESVAIFPRNVREEDTEDFIAWKCGRKPVKAKFEQKPCAKCFTMDLVSL